MRSLVTVAAFAATAFAVPAIAQDNAASADSSFSGPRVEGLVGWDRVQNHGHDSGVNYGVGAGYDFQSGGMVFGVEAEAADSTTKRCVGARTPVDPRICAKSGRDLYVGGRVGTVVGSRTLLRIRRETVERQLADPDTRTALHRVGLDSFDALLARYTAGPDEMQAFLGTGPVLTDDRPLLEYHRSLDGSRGSVDVSSLRGDVTRHLQP